MELNDLTVVPPWDWPAGAGKMILGALVDPKTAESDRMLSAELAADSTEFNDDIARALLAIACRESEPVNLRHRSLISLGPALDYADTQGFDDEEDIMISESMLDEIQDALHELYLDSGTPEDVRRGALEASVRAPREWHAAAIRAAHEGEDPSWKLTAAFCMRFVRGFDRQILEGLKSRDSMIHYHAVCAAGTWSIREAWPHVAKLVSSGNTGKSLRLAAIEASATIEPGEATEILGGLTEDEDDDIAGAASEAITMAEGFSEYLEENEE